MSFFTSIIPSCDINCLYGFYIHTIMCISIMTHISLEGLVVTYVYLKFILVITNCKIPIDQICNTLCF
jgi:hypothetical protein